MLKAKGRIKVDQKKSRVVVETSDDIIGLYDWFIRKQYWIRLGTPLHGAHITIVLPSRHGDIDWHNAKKYDGQEIEFEYDPYLIRGGYTKGFIMFYLKVASKDIDKIKEDLKVVETETYKGLHLTVATGKGCVRPYWPEIIEIR